MLKGSREAGGGTRAPPSGPMELEDRDACHREGWGAQMFPRCSQTKPRGAVEEPPPQPGSLPWGHGAVASSERLRRPRCGAGSTALITATGWSPPGSSLAAMDRSHWITWCCSHSAGTPPHALPSPPLPAHPAVFPQAKQNPKS